MEKSARGLIGIYQILNDKTGECYVGSSLSIHNRLKKHLLDLTKGIHINRTMQESWNRDGACSFQLSILELVNSCDELSEREIHWIKERNAQSIGFNTKTDQFKSRTHISLNLSTKHDLEALHLGSMDKTIKKLVEEYKKQSA
ncbi:MAG: GIY-YIG nuclease family protein [Candidatus Peregrinibacteria bacterium]